VEDLSSSCIVDFDLIVPYVSYDKNDVHILFFLENDQSCQLEASKLDLIPEIPIEHCIQFTEVQSIIRRGFFKPLKQLAIIHAYPLNFFEYLPMFIGGDHITVEKNLEDFQNFIDNFEIMHEDVVMRIFFKSLFGDVALWFRNLESCSIGSWTDFHYTFFKYWGEYKSLDLYLSEFYALKKESDEIVTKFNRRFQGFYLNMPIII